MAKTLVISGKIGPAFVDTSVNMVGELAGEVNVLCQECKADFINYIPQVMFDRDPVMWNDPLFCLCDNCWSALLNDDSEHAGFRY